KPVRSTIFSSYLPPLPSSPLFPYTTLFRSSRCCMEIWRAKAMYRLLVDEAEFKGRLDSRKPAPQRFRRGYYTMFLDHILQAHEGDRKSTRLNSSHVSISYAVFCLKKKNTKD